MRRGSALSSDDVSSASSQNLAVLYLPRGPTGCRSGCSRHSCTAQSRSACLRAGPSSPKGKASSAKSAEERRARSEKARQVSGTPMHDRNSKLGRGQLTTTLSGRVDRRFRPKTPTRADPRRRPRKGKVDAYVSLSRASEWDK